MALSRLPVTGEDVPCSCSAGPHPAGAVSDFSNWMKKETQKGKSREPGLSTCWQLNCQPPVSGAVLGTPGLWVQTVGLCGDVRARLQTEASYYTGGSPREWVRRGPGWGRPCITGMPAHPCPSPGQPPSGERSCSLRAEAAG